MPGRVQGHTAAAPGTLSPLPLAHSSLHRAWSRQQSEEADDGVHHHDGHDHHDAQVKPVTNSLEFTDVSQLSENFMKNRKILNPAPMSSATSDSMLPHLVSPFSAWSTAET